MKVQDLQQFIRSLVQPLASSGARECIGGSEYVSASEVHRDGA
jgi:hypothetical protein